MSFTPPPHRSTRPHKAAAEPRGAGAREFVADWLAHVEAGRIGNNPPMTEEARAAILANERVLRGESR